MEQENNKKTVEQPFNSAYLFNEILRLNKKYL